MNKKDIFFLVILIFFWAIFFHKFFFQGLVPIPGNLLVSFFSPWKEEKWPQYPGGVYKQGLFGFDTARQIYPWRHFSTQQMLKGEWPLWNPYQFAGAPHLANFQTAIFYPLNLLYLLLPQLYAWTTLFMLQFLLSGFSMYLLARKLSISRLGSLVAAFSWAFSLPMSVWAIYNTHGHQYIYLPLIFYLIEVYREKKESKILFWLIAVLSLTFLAGRPECFIFILFFGGFYFFYRIKKIHQWLLVSFATVALTAFAWLPLGEYYLMASREIPSSEFDYLKTLLPKENLITFLAPDFLGNPTTANYWGKSDYTESAVYVGGVAFVFALIAAFSKKGKEKFFILAVLIALAVCFDWFLPRIFYWLKIPLITSSVATRVLFLVAFSLALLAGFGVDAFLKKKKFPKAILLSGLIIILTYIFIFSAPKIFSYKTWFENLRVMKRNLVLPFVVFIVTMAVLFLGLKFKKFKKKLLFLLIPVMALDLFYVANKVIPFTYKELVFPSHPLLEFLQKNSQYYRFAGSKASNIESNFATFYNIFSTEGYDTLYPRYYGELVWAGETGKYNEDISRTTVVLSPKKSDTQRRLEDLLGVKFILEKDDHFESEWDPNYDLFPQDRYQLVWQRRNWKVYENKKVLPRAFLADDYLVIEDKKEIIEKIYQEDFNFSKIIILEEKPQNFLKLGGGESKAEIIDYFPNTVKVKTCAEEDKLLFLSDTFYPGWQVFIDGEKDRIYKADYAFRAVFVPEGEHEVVFSYQPKSFRLGLIISIITLSSILIFVIRYVIIQHLHLRGEKSKGGLRF